MKRKHKIASLTPYYRKLCQSPLKLIFSSICYLQVGPSTYWSLFHNLQDPKTYHPPEKLPCTQGRKEKLIKTAVLIFLCCFHGILGPLHDGPFGNRFICQPLALSNTSFFSQRIGSFSVTGFTCLT